MRAVLLLALFSLAAATTIQNSSQRIVGGSPTTVNHFQTPDQVRVRLGSSFANSGGVIHNAQRFIIYPYENYVTEADIALFRSATFITFSNVVSPSNIAGSQYVVPDNALLLTFGWGENANGQKLEQLQHVQVNAINHALCKTRYPATMPILDTHLCSGILDIGGSNPCEGDAGAPLFHLNAVVGIASYSIRCGDGYYPGVNTKVSSFTDWIVSNAQ